MAASSSSASAPSLAMPPPYTLDARPNERSFGNAESRDATSSSLMRGESTVEDTVTRQTASGVTPQRASSQTPPESNGHSPPSQDPYTSALRHSVQLLELQKTYAQIHNNPFQKMYTGELVTGVTQLLRRSRELEAITLREEMMLLKALLDQSTKLYDSPQHDPILNASLWRLLGTMLHDLQNRLAQQHLSSGITAITTEISAVNEVMRNRSGSRIITQ